MGNYDIIERSDIRQPSVGRSLTRLVFTTPSQSDGIQQIEKHDFKIKKKSNSQLSTALIKLMFHNKSLESCE
jgi:hypothetical protein